MFQSDSSKQLLRVSGMWQGVTASVFPEVPEKFSAIIFNQPPRLPHPYFIFSKIGPKALCITTRLRVLAFLLDPSVLEDDGRKFLRNVYKKVPISTALHHILNRGVESSILAYCSLHFQSDQQIIYFVFSKQRYREEGPRTPSKLAQLVLRKLHSWGLFPSFLKQRIKIKN
jgi:hypothetical protein